MVVLVGEGTDDDVDDEIDEEDGEDDEDDDDDEVVDASHPREGGGGAAVDIVIIIRTRYLPALALLPFNFIFQKRGKDRRSRGVLSRLFYPTYRPSVVSRLRDAALPPPRPPLPAHAHTTQPGPPTIDENDDARADQGDESNIGRRVDDYHDDLANGAVIDATSDRRTVRDVDAAPPVVVLVLVLVVVAAVIIDVVVGCDSIVDGERSYHRGSVTVHRGTAQGGRGTTIEGQATTLVQSIASSGRRVVAIHGSRPR